MTAVFQIQTQIFSHVWDMWESSEFAYKGLWSLQSLRIFYVKELFLSYNIC